jgi:hypothetical protein
MQRTWLAGVLLVLSCAGVAPVGSASPGDAVVTVFWKNRSPNLELSCGHEIRLGTIVAKEVRPNSHRAPGARFTIPPGVGRIGFMLGDPKQMRTRWAWLSHDYECSPSGSLQIEVQTHDPGGRERLALDVRYKGQGCRAPLHEECCSDGPKE